MRFLRALRSVVPFLASEKSSGWMKTERERYAPVFLDYFETAPLEADEEQFRPHVQQLVNAVVTSTMQRCLILEEELADLLRLSGDQAAVTAQSLNVARIRSREIKGILTSEWSTLQKACVSARTFGFDVQEAETYLRERHVPGSRISRNIPKSSIMPSQRANEVQKRYYRLLRKGIRDVFPRRAPDSNQTDDSQ